MKKNFFAFSSFLAILWAVLPQVAHAQQIVAPEKVQPISYLVLPENIEISGNPSSVGASREELQRLLSKLLAAEISKAAEQSNGRIILLVRRPANPPRNLRVVTYSVKVAESSHSFREGGYDESSYGSHGWYYRYYRSSQSSHDSEREWGRVMLSGVTLTIEDEVTGAAEVKEGRSVFVDDLKFVSDRSSFSESSAYGRSSQRTSSGGYREEKLPDAGRGMDALVASVKSLVGPMLRQQKEDEGIAPLPGDFAFINDERSQAIVPAERCPEKGQPFQVMFRTASGKVEGRLAIVRDTFKGKSLIEFVTPTYKGVDVTYSVRPIPEGHTFLEIG